MTEAPGANCLTAGTMIDTPDGPVRIDDLTPGDLVVVMDGPPQPVRMIHAETISGDALKADRALWPVCIQAGALGFGLPRQNLRVSPAHRMLYRHIRIPLMFGEDAVFVRAKSLAATFEEIYVDSSLSEVTYIYLVFDRHEVIFADGAATESFRASAASVAGMTAAARDALLAAFPALAVPGHAPPAAYPTLRSWELMAMVG